MADAVKASVALAVGAAFAVAAMAIAFTLVQPGADSARPVLVPAEDADRDPGSAPLLLSALDGDGAQAAHGIVADSEDGRVIVLKLPVEGLRGAADVHGYNTGQHAIRHPGEPDMAVLAYSARSTHRGCTVAMYEDVASLTGPYGIPGPLLLDPCSQSQWDPYDLATLRPGFPASGPLDVMHLELRPTEGGTGLFVTDRIPQDGARDADLQGGASFSLDARAA